MGISSIAKLFTPKSTVFYDKFEEMASVVVEMGKVFKKMVNTPEREELVKLANRLEDLEHKNDELAHGLLTELGRTFITPFDREDVHALAISLDDVCDGIYASAKKIKIFGINPDETGIRKMAEIIEEGTNEVLIMIESLRDMKNLKAITKSIVKLNSIENQADDVYDMSMEKLFDLENDFKNLIKKRDIYQTLEFTSDKLEDVSNVVETIVIKYS